MLGLIITFSLGTSSEVLLRTCQFCALLMADFCVVSDSECQPNVAGFKAVTIDVNWWEQKNISRNVFQFWGTCSEVLMCKGLLFRNLTLGTFQNLYMCS